MKFVIYALTAVVVIAQAFTIYDRMFGHQSVHPVTVWTVFPSLILCAGILAILQAINKRKMD